MNDVRFTGRIVRNPEMRQTDNGVSVCNFDIAVKRKYSKDEVDFIRCVAWRQTAEFVSKYFPKGSSILVMGELHQKKYTDKDGNNRTDYEVSVNDVEFFSSKSDNSGAQQNNVEKPAPKAEPEPAAEAEDDEEDLPF